MNSKETNQINKDYQISVCKEGSTYSVDLESDGMFHQYVHFSSSGVPELGYKDTATKHAVQKISATTLRFTGIPDTMGVENVLHVVNAIVAHEQVRHRLSAELVGAINAMAEGNADITTNDEPDFVVFRNHSNVSLYINHDFALVFCQTKQGNHCIFEDKMKFKSDEIDWANDGTNTLVFEGKEYPDLRYIEDGVYEFSFDFPQDEESIREHVLALAGILFARS